MQSKVWEFFSNSISKCSLEELTSNSEFMQTMFCGSYEKEELEYLRSKLNLEEIERLVWEPVESMTELNNIHQLYHFIKFKEFMKDTYLKPKFTEFGAGYGSLCKIINNLLKVEEYNIIELPKLQRVQADYLELNCIHNVNFYNNLEEYFTKERSGTFIALWSMSETDQEVRDFFMEKANFDNYLFAFGKEFFGIENYEYFEEFQRQRPELTWEKNKIEFMNDQYYLWGKNEKN